MDIMSYSSRKLASGVEDEVSQHQPAKAMPAVSITQNHRITVFFYIPDSLIPFRDTNLTKL